MPVRLPDATPPDTDRGGERLPEREEPRRTAPARPWEQQPEPGRRPEVDEPDREVAIPA